MIKFNQVSQRYPGGFSALTQVDFSLEKGEMVFLTGHSGAGKSTFLNLIALLQRPSSGQIIVDGIHLNQLKKQHIADFRLRLGIAFQTPKLLSNRSVFDNVALPLQVQGYPSLQMKKRVHAALDCVGLLHHEKYFPAYLSGGEQQRLGIARALVHRPRLLLADEPTGNLDPMLARDLMRLFAALNETGMSVLIATHDLALIASMNYRIVTLKGGRVC